MRPRARWLFALVGFVFALICVQQAQAQSWYSSSWLYRKSITIDFTKVGATVTNFPVLINLASDPNLAAGALATGNDILFTSSNGTTKLNHEIEKYTGATGLLVAWVQVPSVSSVSNTVIYMYYGNAAAANQQSVTATWDANYKAVWHLKESVGGVGAIKDSTANAKNATDTNGVVLGAAGQMGNAFTFDGANDYVSVGANALGSLPSYTVSAWLKTSSGSGTILSEYSGAGCADFEWYLSNAGKPALHDGASKTTQSTTTNVASNTWRYVVGTNNGATSIIYIDGVQNVTGSNVEWLNACSTTDVRIGNTVNGGLTGFAATLDEIRVSNSVRSAGWISTEYNNQKNPGTFYALSAQMTVPSAATSTVVASPTSVAADGTTTSTITVTLKDAAGAAVAGKAVTLAQGTGSSVISAASGVSSAGGVVTFTVTNTTVQSVTYTATDTTDGVTITQTAAVSFTALVSGFNVVEPGANAVTGKIFTKVAGQNFSVDIVALSATNLVLTLFTGPVAVEIVDNTSGGACAGLPLIATFTNQTFSAADLGRHTLTAPNTVANVYRNTRFRIKYPAASPTVTACSGDNFAIRPDSLSFAVTDANRTTAGATNSLTNSAIAGVTVHNAGRPFRVAATAYNRAATPAVTSNYNGTPTAVLTACVGTACTATTGTVTVGAWSASGGTVTTTTASYDDVGAFNLQLQDSTFASVDAADGTSAVQLTVSSTPIAVGRFVPDRFVVSAGTITPRTDIAACAASTFTYMGERMNAVFTLTAVRYPSGTTTRYTGTLARLALTSPASFSFGAIDGATVLGSRLDTSLGTSGTWSNGAATVTAILAVQRAAAPDGPFNSFRLGIAASDPDAVAMDPASLNLDADASGSNERAQIGGAVSIRFGRLRLQNAVSSQVLAAPVPIEAQYWNGSAFVTNIADNCTSIAAANVALGNYQKNLAAGETTVTVGGAFSAGVGALRLSAPGAANNGAVDVSVNLGVAAAGASCTAGMPASTALLESYLQGAWCGASYNRDPTARVTFGLYRAPDKMIYRRENF
jgi:hypothetical protein